MLLSQLQARGSMAEDQPQQSMQASIQARTRQSRDRAHEDRVAALVGVQVPAAHHPARPQSYTLVQHCTAMGLTHAPSARRLGHSAQYGDRNPHKLMRWDARQG